MVEDRPHSKLQIKRLLWSFLELQELSVWWKQRYLKGVWGILRVGERNRRKDNSDEGSIWDH